ncbi:hypothetical protein ACK34S_17920 [Aeromonas hydrophila]
MNEVNCTACLGWEGRQGKRGDGRKERGDNANIRIRSAILTYGLPIIIRVTILFAAKPLIFSLLRDGDKSRLIRWLHIAQNQVLGFKLEHNVLINL